MAVVHPVVALRSEAFVIVVISKRVCVLHPVQYRRYWLGIVHACKDIPFARCGRNLKQLGTDDTRTGQVG
jgi:hypothetical protein